MGEFSASLFTKPGYITQTNIPIGNPAAVGDIGGWTNPQDNKSATIVYKVDIENGRATYFLSQSLSTVFEGATGPGIVFRGPYTGSVEYLFDLNQKRRDAVLYDKDGDGVPEMYYATLQIVPSSSIGGESTSITPFGDIGGTSADYWEELGEQEFFVAAKIAIFEESFVENSINVGIPDPGNVNSKIAIVGGTQEPYIAIGQEIQGYNQEGVFVGVSWDDIASGSKYGKLSLKNTAGDRYLRWDGENLEIAGTIQVTGGNAATAESVSGSFPTNTQTASLENPSSYAFGPDASFPLEALPATPTTPGLYLGSDYLGYHDGANWNAFLDDSGNFYLGGDEGGALKFTQATGNLNVTGIVSASAGQFGGWVIDSKGISYRAPFAVGFQNNLSTTARYHGSSLATLIETAGNEVTESYAGLPYVDGTPMDAFFRGPDTTFGYPLEAYGTTFPLENDSVGASRLRVFGTTTTTHAILASGSGDYGLDYGLEITPGLYAESSSLQIQFYQTASIVISADSGAFIWPESTTYINLEDSDSIPQTLSDFIPLDPDWIQSCLENGYNLGVLNYLHAYDVPVLGVGNVQDLYFIITDYDDSNNRLVLSDAFPNTYGTDVDLTAAESLTLYVAMVRGTGDFATIFEGSTSAGSRTLVTSTGEAVRLHTSGSTTNNVSNSRPFFSLGQITQSYDQTGVFIGFPSGSNTPRFSIRSIEGQFIRWNGESIQLSGDIIGSTIEGSNIVGGAINVPTTGTGSRFSVDSVGNVSASNANIQGIINADSGRIGQWVIDAETGNLQDSDAEVVFDPSIPELQFYTGSGDGRTKKVSISPQDALSPVGATTQTLNITGSTTIGTTSPVTGVTSDDSSAFPVYGTYHRTGLTSTGGSTSDGKFNVTQVGDIQVTLTVPNFSVATPNGTVVHQTSYPNYVPPFMGFIHSGYASPRSSYAQLWLEAVQVSTGNVVGSTLLGQAFANSAYTIGNYYLGYNDEVGGGIGPGEENFFSVTGDTLITTADGNKIFAKDVIEGEQILAWNWNSKLDNSVPNQFGNYYISKVSNRIVDKIYEISAGGKVVKVSDTHGFWLDGNKQIKACDLIEGVSEINVKDGDSIKLVTVDSVNIIEDEVTVYTFEVPGVHNYISNDIISHNTWYWDYIGSQTISAQQFPYTGGGTKTINMLISSAGNIQLRYAVRFGASSGTVFDKDSTINLNGGTLSYPTQTVNSFATAPGTLDTSLEVESPANFVELRAGGIQVVSDPERYVRIPRRPRGSSDATLMQIEGGTLFTNLIMPSTDVSPSETFDIGNGAARFKDVYATNFNNGNSSIGSNGYNKLTNGLIIQWGYATGTTIPTNVAFPLTFPNGCYSVSVTTDRNSSGASGHNHAYDVTTTGFKAVMDSPYDGWWIAIGY